MEMKRSLDLEGREDSLACEASGTVRKGSVHRRVGEGEQPFEVIGAVMRDERRVNTAGQSSREDESTLPTDISSSVQCDRVTHGPSRPLSNLHLREETPSSAESVSSTCLKPNPTGLSSTSSTLNVEPQSPTCGGNDKYSSVTIQAENTDDTIPDSQLLIQSDKINSTEIVPASSNLPNKYPCQYSHHSTRQNSTDKREGLCTNRNRKQVFDTKQDLDSKENSLSDTCSDNKRTCSDSPKNLSSSPKANIDQLSPIVQSIDLTGNSRLKNNSHYKGKLSAKRYRKRSDHLEKWHKMRDSLRRKIIEGEDNIPHEGPPVTAEIANSSDNCSEKISSSRESSRSALAHRHESNRLQVSREHLPVNAVSNPDESDIHSLTGSEDTDSSNSPRLENSNLHECNEGRPYGSSKRSWPRKADHSVEWYKMRDMLRLRNRGDDTSAADGMSNATQEVKRSLLNSPPLCKNHSAENIPTVGVPAHLSGQNNDRPKRKSFQQAVSTIKTYLSKGDNRGLANSKTTGQSSDSEMSEFSESAEVTSSSNSDIEFNKYSSIQKYNRKSNRLAKLNQRSFSKSSLACKEKSDEDMLEDTYATPKRSCQKLKSRGNSSVSSSISNEEPQTFVLSFSAPNTFNNLPSGAKSKNDSREESSLLVPSQSSNSLVQCEGQQMNGEEASKEDELSEFLLFPQRESSACSSKLAPSELVDEEISTNCEDSTLKFSLGDSPQKRVLDGPVSIQDIGFQNMKMKIKRYKITAKNISKLGIKNILNGIVNSDGNLEPKRVQMGTETSTEVNDQHGSEPQVRLRTYSRKNGRIPDRQCGQTETQRDCDIEDSTSGAGNSGKQDDCQTRVQNVDSSDEDVYQIVYGTNDERQKVDLCDDDDDDDGWDVGREGRSLVSVSGEESHSELPHDSVLSPHEGTVGPQPPPSNSPEPQLTPHLHDLTEPHPPNHLISYFESSGKKVIMECTDEDLSETQKDYYDKRKKEYLEFQRKFEIVSRRPDVTVEKGETCSFLEYFSVQNPLISSAAAPVIQPTSLATQNGRIIPGAQSAGLVLLNNPSSGGPARVGLLVPTSTAGLPAQLVSSSLPLSGQTVIPSLSMASNWTTPNYRTILSKAGSSATTNLVDAAENPVKFLVRPKKRKLDAPAVLPSTEPPPTETPTSPITVQTTKNIIKPRPLHTLMVDLTDELSPASRIDYSTSSSSGAKTYPSLIVLAKPCLHEISEEDKVTHKKLREDLDARMKKVLVLSTKNFTEWLVQSGLVRTLLYCPIHKGTTEDYFVKLGMYTDPNKFPLSGGYVWISDCCPQLHISVFTGSIFESSSFHPATIMKLIYHWACQTSIQNMMQWVTVSSINMKNLFTNLRAVCTAAIHEHFGVIGGFQKNIQLAVISLGVNKQSGIKRSRVEVLSVYDPVTKYIRMRAIEPGSELESTSKKFWKIFAILPSWVDKNSTILVDNTIDTVPLQAMGYKSVCGTPEVDSSGQERFPNHELMAYLCPIVRSMFQKTLAILSRVVLQQFLDELVWRERWGYHASLAFDNILKHLIEQTKLDTGGTLLNRLSKISANPFKDWRYSEWNFNASSKMLQTYFMNSSRVVSHSSVPPPARVAKVLAPIKLPASANPMAPVQPLLASVNSQIAIPFPPSQEVSLSQNQIAVTSDFIPSREAAKILLEPYFYGWIDGTKDKVKILDFQSSCFICRRNFTDNMELSDHLISHVFNKGPISGDLNELCKLCLKLFPSEFFLQKHMEETHLDVNNPTLDMVCLICNMKMKDTMLLITHISRVHSELEMPYICNNCGYRTSMFHRMQQHLAECLKNGSCSICPYCFKVIDLYRNGKPSIKNQCHFFYHVQKHQLTLSKKCMKCAIWCVNKSILCEHETLDHKSCASRPGVVRYEVCPGVLMPAPLTDPPNINPARYQLSVGGPYKIITDSKPPVMSSDDISRGAVCIECDAKLFDSHFLNDLWCMKCEYITCCIRAMIEHHTTCHPVGASASLQMMRHIPVISDVKLHCSCSFSTNDGNVMAYHLVICNKMTCYDQEYVSASPISEDELDQGITVDATDEESDNDVQITPALDATYTVSTWKSSISDATFIIDK